jgi:Phage tail tube protein
MPFKTGKDCKLYIGTAGSQANTLVPNIVDLKLAMQKTSGDSATRASGGWGSKKTVERSVTVTFDMRWDSADANFVAIRNAFLNDTAISGLVLSGLKTVVGENGLDADFEVEGFDVDQPLKDGVKVSVTLVVNTDLRNPAWYTVPTP